MKGGSGIFIDANNETAFLNFMNNSRFEFLRNGSNGTAFIATLNPNQPSEYKHLDASLFGTPVRKLIIKLIMLTPAVFSKKKMQTAPGSYLSAMKQHAFPDEVNIQTEIFLKTMNYLRPLCPAIVYADEFPKSNYLNIQIIDDSIRNAAKNEVLVLMLKLRQFFIDNNNDYGIIAMEYADGYLPIANALVQIPNFSVNQDSVLLVKNVFNKIRLHLIDLAIETGYTHGDFHQANLLLNNNSNTMYEGNPGDIMLIDFGYAIKIDIDKLEEIKTLYKEKKYSKILIILCNIPRAIDGYVIANPKSRQYAYMCGTFSDDESILIDNAIDELITRKNQSIDKLIQTFHSKSASDRALYPLLPLSNRIKNKMYSGISKNDFQLIDLSHISGDLLIFKDTDFFKNLLTWIYINCKTNNSLNHFVDCCYLYIYIFTLDNFEENVWTLLAVPAFYKLNIITTVSELNHAASNYNNETIMKTINHIMPKLRHKRIHTFVELLSEHGMQTYNIILHNRAYAVELMSRIDTYINLEGTAALFGKKTYTSHPGEDYVYPFAEEDDIKLYNTVSRSPRSKNIPYYTVKRQRTPSKTKKSKRTKASPSPKK